MEPLAPNGQQFGRQNDPNKILNECREIDRGIDEIKASLATLATLQQRSLDDSDSSAQSSTNRQLDAISADTMTMYRNFAGRIKAIKQQPESGSPKNAPQVGKIDRKLKAAIQEYQSMDSAFRRKLQDQMARQYRIVRPDATEQEVREAVEDTSNQQQMFSQALLQSDRRGQSRAALSAVENRHQAIQKIESQMIELAELFQDMEALVVQQEAAVVNIEMKGEEVVENLDKGNQEIGTAIVSARNARKWKWWCLGICGMFSYFHPPLSTMMILTTRRNSPHHRHYHHHSRHLPLRRPITRPQILLKTLGAPRALLHPTIHLQRRPKRRTICRPRPRLVIRQLPHAHAGKALSPIHRMSINDRRQMQRHHK
jgi:syntaxin 1B/2/3